MNTFEGETGKISSKIGILGKSFAEIDKLSKQRIQEAVQLMSKDPNLSFKEAKMMTGRWYDYVFSKKQDKSYDLNLFKQYDEQSAKKLLAKLQVHQTKINSGLSSGWGEYFNTLNNGTGINEGQKWQRDFVTSFNVLDSNYDQLADAAKNAREEAIKFNNTLENSTLKAKAANVAIGGLKTIGNALAGAIASWGISFVVNLISSAITKVIFAQKEALEQTQSATKEYQESSNSLSDYKDRIIELNKELNSGNISYSEARNKRSELMTIQDELIKKYGVEKSAIQDITDAINGQSDSIDNLGKKSYDEWYRDANHRPWYSYNRK